MIGCGLPATYFLKSNDKGAKIGYGMISRGEVGIIIAGVAISAGAIDQSIYGSILAMIMITTLLGPLLLRKAYENTPPEDELKPEVDTTAPDYIPTYPLDFNE